MQFYPWTIKWRLYVRLSQWEKRGERERTRLYHVTIAHLWQFDVLLDAQKWVHTYTFQCVRNVCSATSIKWCDKRNINVTHKRKYTPNIRTAIAQWQYLKWLFFALFCFFLLEIESQGDEIAFSFYVFRVCSQFISHIFCCLDFWWLSLAPVYFKSTKAQILCIFEEPFYLFVCHLPSQLKFKKIRKIVESLLYVLRSASNVRIIYTIVTV